MTMTTIDGGSLLVQALKRQGVKYLFSLCGGHIWPIYNACLEEGIKIIDTRHEEAAAHMAEGWALVTGQPGVCCVTAGPGLTNAVTGVANAFCAGSPMILISGHSPASECDRGSLQELDQLALMRPITKWARAVLDVHRIPEYTIAAFRHAISGRPGPTYLEIPIDVLLQKIEGNAVACPPAFSTLPRSAAEPSLIEEAAKILAQSHQPMVIAGSGIWWSQASSALARFIEATHFPLFTKSTARGSLPGDHPLAFRLPTSFALSNADAIILAGCRPNFLLAFGQFNPHAKIIQIDVEIGEIGCNRPVDVPLAGDARLVLEQLAEAVKPPDVQAWVARLQEERQKQKEAIKAQIASSSSPIHPLRLVKEVQDYLERDATIVVDGGDISVLSEAMLTSYQPGHYLSTIGPPFGCLGVGPSFALSAKLARPNTQVVLISGDGSFGLNAMEFDTAWRHNLPIVVVISNDQGWGMIKHGQRLLYGEEREVGTILGVRHYEKMVAGLGGYGELVERPEDIRPALERAFASGLPACINVLTDPNVTSPMTIALCASWK